jgi:bifunctional non-homologous end joining protein LigD
MNSPEKLLERLFPPMLATLAGQAPGGSEEWAYELKYDGFRAVAALVDGKLAMWSRNELDLIPRFPRVAAALRRLKVREAVLDGEIVAVDAAGIPRFQLLQGGDQRERIFIFDVLWLDGEDLRRRPYSERRSILQKLLRRPPAGVELAQQLRENGDEALERAAAEGYEGIIAKRRSSSYEGRRSKQWLKVKAINQQELAIVGYNSSTASSREIGSLHLAVKGDDGALHYAGKVGTGFSAKVRTELKAELDKDRVAQPAVKGAPRVRDAQWVRPRLVAQVAFAEWTADGRLRHPSFLGLRFDKSPEDVVREKVISEHAPKKASKRSRAAAAKPRAKKPTPSKSREKKLNAPAASPLILTHPERLLYPRDGITKADVAAYYEALSEPMIHALHDRPLALEHWNQGIGHGSWFHQNLGREAPPWLTTVDTPTRTGTRGKVRHLVVDSEASLRWLAQMSVLTIHMWSSRAGSLSEPDWVVFDLDPAEGKGIEQAIEAAIVLRGLLEHLELPSVPKTSGKRGIHIFVPLAAGYTHEQANAFACGIAAAVTREVPSMTVDRALSRRRGRLYLDCMQNAYGKTMVAPYSPRAIDGAPVSAPLKWDEVNRKLDPKKFNIRTMPNRLARVGDLFAEALKNGARLPELK